MAITKLLPVVQGAKDFLPVPPVPTPRGLAVINFSQFTVYLNNADLAPIAGFGAVPQLSYMVQIPPGFLYTGPFPQGMFGPADYLWWQVDTNQVGGIGAVLSAPWIELVVSEDPYPVQLTAMLAAAVYPDTLLAAGAVTAPAAGAAIATIPAGGLIPGKYQVYLSLHLMGAAALIDLTNVQLQRGPAPIGPLVIAPSLSPADPIQFTMPAPVVPISINAIAAGTAGVTYAAAIRATRVG